MAVVKTVEEDIIILILLTILEVVE